MGDGSLERENTRLREQLEELTSRLDEKESRIQELEQEVVSRRTSRSEATTQTRHMLSLRPQSMHDVSSNNNNTMVSLTSLTTKPCHHSRGPCANDHSHHTSRSRGALPRWAGWSGHGDPPCPGPPVRAGTPRTGQSLPGR